MWPVRNASIIIHYFAKYSSVTPIIRKTIRNNHWFPDKTPGSKKGEAAFDEYLQEQMLLKFTSEAGSVISYENLISTATGERSLHKTEGRTK